MAMGFPSPARDYTEDRLTVDTICRIDANSLIVETSSGYAVIDKSLPACRGDTVFITNDGVCRFAKVTGDGLIIDDGEGLMGEALDGVTVHGVLTHSITVFSREDGPV